MKRTNLLSSAKSKCATETRDLFPLSSNTATKVVYRCVPWILYPSGKFIHLSQETFFTYLSGNRPFAKRWFLQLFSRKSLCCKSTRVLLSCLLFKDALIMFSAPPNKCICNHSIHKTKILSRSNRRLQEH